MKTESKKETPSFISVLSTSSNTMKMKSSLLPVFLTHTHFSKKGCYGLKIRPKNLASLLNYLTPLWVNLPVVLTLEFSRYAIKRTKISSNPKISES